MVPVQIGPHRFHPFLGHHKVILAPFMRLLCGRLGTTPEELRFDGREARITIAPSIP